MLALVELSAALDDQAIARAAYDALLPYADLPLMASMAIVCFGSVHRALGIAALAIDKADLAIEHFAAGLAANQDLGHRPAAIQCQAELAPGPPAPQRRPRSAWPRAAGAGDPRC